MTMMPTGTDTHTHTHAEETRFKGPAKDMPCHVRLLLLHC